MCWIYCRKCNGKGLKFADLPRERTSKDRCGECGGFGYSYISDINEVEALKSFQACIRDEWTTFEWEKLEQQEINQFKV